MKLITLFLLFLLSVLPGHAYSPGYPVYGMLKKTTYRIVNLGTGSAVKTPSGKRIILTNWHVCLFGWKNKLKINNEYYETSADATIIKEDPAHDLCALEMPFPFNDVLEVSDLDKVKFGTQLYSAGYPAGAQTIKLFTGTADIELYTNLTYYVPGGKCPAGFNVKLNPYDATCVLRILLQDTSLSCAPGQSGSAVINSKGQLVGVINSTNKPGKYSKQYGSMIPLRHVRAFLNSL
jgi:S1-C subfamily serine protease